MSEEIARGRLPDPRSAHPSVTRRPSPSLAARIKMLEAGAEMRNGHGSGSRLSPSPSPHRSRSRARAGSISAVSEMSGASSAIDVPTSIPTALITTPSAPRGGLMTMNHLPPTPVEDDDDAMAHHRPSLEYSSSMAPTNGSSANPTQPTAGTADTSEMAADDYVDEGEDGAYSPLSNGLRRRASVVSLSRASFAAQLSRLTSLSLPLTEELSERIRQLPTAEEMCEALAGAGKQIGRWIETAKKVLDGLDAEDDVEWAAQGRESLNEVDYAVRKFSDLMNVYIGLIDVLQARPDSDSVESDTLLNIVTAMEETVDGWKEVQELLRGVKDQVETAMEWNELWTTILQDIQAELDACQTLVFELEERRHRSLAEDQGSVDIDTLETIMEENPGAPFPMPNGKTPTEIEDSSLLRLFARMQPLRASLDFLPMRISGFTMRADDIFPTACEELMTRRRQLEKKWAKLNADAEGLKRELGEDRWVAIFRNAGRQASAMMESIERSMNKLREAIITWDDTAGQNDQDLGKKMESYEAKKMHYGTAIQRTFGIIGKGISDRFTVNGEIIRLDSAMRQRWRHLEQQMLDVDQTLHNLQLNSQALRDSISSLTSLDLNSNGNTPGTSPASSIAVTSPNRRRSPSLSRPSAPSSRKSSVSYIPRSPYTLQRAPGSPSLSSTPNLSPRDSRSVPPASFSRAVSSPVSSTSSSTARRIPSLTRTTSSLSNRPKWNASVKSDGNFGHNFKPLTLTTPSPYRKSSSSAPSASQSGRHSAMGSATRIPVPSPLAQNTLSPSNPFVPRLAPGLVDSITTTGQRRISMPAPASSSSYMTSPSPAARTSRPELRSQYSTGRLRDPSAGSVGSAPRINIRPASAMSQGGASGRRSSMLPRPPSGVGNRQSMPPGSAKPRWRP